MALKYRVKAFYFQILGISIFSQKFAFWKIPGVNSKYDHRFSKFLPQKPEEDFFGNTILL